MATPPTSVSTLDRYQLRLPVFEGPLDVLLRLIEREQLEISEVSLISVFDQFVTFLQTLDSPPVVVAEFLAVAGRLSLLKSRALLPKPQMLVEEPDEFDLVQQLEEYRVVKAAADVLAGRQRDGSGIFGRGDGIASPNPAPSQFAPQSPTSLANAVGRWLTRFPVQPTVMASRSTVSLRVMIGRISAAFDERRRVSFEEIVGSCSCRQEVGVAFLAVLILLRRQAVRASQAEIFGAILLQRSQAPRDYPVETLQIERQLLDGRQ